VPSNGQSGALNGVYQFQHIDVSHFTGPFHILTASVADALVLTLPQAVSVSWAGSSTCWSRSRTSTTTPNSTARHPSKPRCRC
jgi:hypothetical protein